MSDAEAFLRDFHAEHSGATPVALQGQGVDGRTSYDVLAERVPRDAGPLTVLDLACGDGPLLERLAARGQPGLELIGIDMSPDELRMAQRRLSGRGVELRLERAQDLSLPDASADYVLSHLAFMLMSPIEPVVAQIRRVLRPGAAFAAVVSGEPTNGDAWHAFGGIARELMQQHPRAGVPALGDRRVHSATGLASLFNASTGFEEPIEIRDFVIRLDGPLDQVRRCLLLMYVVNMVSPAGLRSLEARTDAMLRSLQRADGTVPCSMGLRLAVCRRAGER